MRRLSIGLPESLHQQIKARASLEGLSMRAYVLRRLDIPSDPAPRNENRASDNCERESMRELIHNRSWRGTQTKAEIDARIAAERTSWHD